MQTFILSANIRLFKSYLSKDMADSERRFVTSKLAELERELALVEAASVGTQVFSRAPRTGIGISESGFADLAADPLRRYMVVDPGAGLSILGANRGFAEATLTRRSDIVGQALFDVFPDNPDLPQANGVVNLFESLRMAAISGRPHKMAVQRYDVRNDSGQFVERYWRPINTPIFSDSGKLAWLLHEAVDVTDTILSLRTHRSDNAPRGER